MRYWSIVILTIIFGACKKDAGILGKRSTPTLDTPLSLQLDSTCMKAPNFITANGDGINDQFTVIHYEPLQAISLTIVNPNGTIVFTATDDDPSWSGTDTEFVDVMGPIPYLYSVQVITMSGVTHSTSKVLYVIRDIHNECITPDVQPIGGDQFEPRRLCDLLYATNDYVCMD